MGVPYVGADPAEFLGVLGRREAELLARVGDVVIVLGQVGVHRHAIVARQQRRLAHQVARDGKRRARRHHHAQHGVARSVVVLLDQPLAVFQDGVLLLHHRIGRQATLAAAHAHRSARGMKTHAHCCRGGNGIVQARAVGIQVQVIAGGGAAGQHQLGHRGAGRHIDHFRRQVRPQHIEVGEPREQLDVLRRRHGAGQALVHVVVRVDQPGDHHLATHVDHLGTALVDQPAVLRRQLGGGAYPFDHRALRHQRAARNLAALRIHGHQDVGIDKDEGHGRVFGWAAQGSGHGAGASCGPAQTV